MRRFCALLLGIMVTALFQAMAATTYTYSFADSSPLATGRWVKITVSESGIYELSYDLLRAMGFSDPEAVGVYGQGGAMCSYTFEDFKSSRKYEDVAPAVPVWHEEGKICFYGRGIEEIAFNGNTFSRSAINLYSPVGTYLLSDSLEPLRLEFASGSDIEESGVSAVNRDYGYDYQYHELDLEHNSLGTGRMFWGENFLESPELSFPLRIPFAHSGIKMTLGADIACYGGAGMLTASLPGYSKEMKSAGSQPGLTPLTFTAIPVPTGPADLLLSFSGDDPDIARLDKWVLTYAKRFPEEASLRQERIAFAGGVTGLNSFRIPKGMRVLDVSSPGNPKVCPTDGSSAYFTGSRNPSRLIVFDPAKQQLEPSSWTIIPRQDLHALAHQYNSLLIITMPQWRSYAERIAQLHRDYDRIGVAVVEPQEIYNEFSGGNPDPMAYRALVKLLFQSRTNKLRNVLFLGPIYADSRNVRGIDRPDGFVSFLHPFNGFETEEAKVPTVLDWPGYVCDVIYNENYYFREPMEVGVGYLPVVSKSEAELAVSKIEDYLEMGQKGGLERYANRITIIGGEGNDGLHHDMAIDAAADFQKMSGELSDSRFDITTLSIDATGEEDCRNQLNRALEEGSALTVYFGHGSSSALNGRFWDSRSFMTLNNRPAGFMLSAGCRLSETDLGRRGVGDIGILEAPHGLVGAITSTRTIFAERNEKIMKAMQAAMLTTDSVTPRHTNASIGEIYALGKTLSAEDAEAAFYYVGDPALTFPLAVNPARIHAYTDRSYVPGEVVSFFGSILESDGEYVDTSASGDMVIRIYTPDSSLDFNDSRKSLVVPGELLAKIKASFSHGRFSSLKFKLDEKLKELQLPDEEVSLPIFITAYDSKYGRAYCGNDILRLAPAGTDYLSGSLFDTTPPEISIEEDAAKGTLLITAADDTALQPDRAFRLVVDGEEIELAETGGDYAVRSHTARFAMLALEPGSHKASVTATDMAGNQSPPAEFDFTVSLIPALSLSADSLVAAGMIEFNLHGYEGSGPLILHIVDADNNTVFRDTAEASKLIWNTGEALPGMYRAAVLEDSPAGAIVRSPWLSFSVIR